MNPLGEEVVDWTNPWTSTTCPKKNKSGTLKVGFASDVTRRDISPKIVLTKASSTKVEKVEETAETLRLALEPYSTNYPPRTRQSSLRPSPGRIFDRARRGDAVWAQ